MIWTMALVLSISGAQIDYNSVPCKLVVPGEIIQSNKDSVSRFCLSDDFSNGTSTLHSWLYLQSKPVDDINPYKQSDMVMYLCEISTLIYSYGSGRYKSTMMVDTLKDGDFRKVLLHKHCKDKK